MSYLLAGGFLGAWLITVWLLWKYGQKKLLTGGMPTGGLNAMAIVMALSGVLFSGFAFIADYRLRVTTLREEVIEGSKGIKVGDAAPVREVVFNVEHPGIEHELLVAPIIGTWDSAFPASIAVRLLDTHNNEILNVVDQFVPERSSRGMRIVWGANYYRFTPAQTGPHKVVVTPITVEIPSIHIRIEDPEKKDGVRASGY